MAVNVNFGNDFGNKDLRTKAPERKTLAGDKIHDVYLKEIKSEKITSKNGDEYDTILMTFSDENGLIYQDRTFELNEQSYERKPSPYDANKKQPSQYDSTIIKFRCYLEHLAPKLHERLMSGELTLKMNNWKQFKETMISIFEKVAAKEDKVMCKLKLLKNNAGFASLPFFCALSTDGNPYVSNNFIGNIATLGKEGRELTFTPSEIKKIKAREQGPTQATPDTDLPAAELGAQTDLDNKDLDIDVNDLNLDD